MKTELIQTRVTSDVKERMQSVADMNGQSLSEMIRNMFIIHEKMIRDESEAQ